MRKEWWMIILVLVALLVVVASYNYITTGVLFAPKLSSGGADSFSGEVESLEGVSEEELKEESIFTRYFGNEDRVAPRTFKVFATDSNFTGDVLNRADEICNGAASNAGLRGNYVALLSTTREHAADKIQDGKYVRVDGVKVADNKRDLFDGTIDNPLNVNEFGNVLPTLTCDSNGFECNLIYTGSKVDGTLDPGFNCNDWNSISALSTVGHYPSVDHNWINTNNVSCSEVLGIYCFESYVPRPSCNRVYTAQDLDNVRNDLDACYIQMADIDLGSWGNWEPIGYLDINTFPGPNDRPFTGRYDGNGFKITNFEIPEENLSALFAYSTGVLENVTIDGFNIDSRAAPLIAVGSLVAVNGGVVRNSLAKNGFMRIGLSYFSEAIGGLIGANIDGDIMNSGVKNVTIFGSFTAGGLMGLTLYGIIEGTYAEDVKVQGQGGFVGGLIGRMQHTNITDSYATGNVSGGMSVGGLIGSFRGSMIFASSVTIKNSYSFGIVNGSYNVGGLVGITVGKVNITNSFSSSKVSGRSSVGGFIGRTRVGARGNFISNSYATGDVLGSNNVGGFLGYNRGTISNSYSTGHVLGDGRLPENSNVGGLLGYNDGGTVNNSYSTGDVVGRENVGGLLGQNNENGIISNSYSTGSVSGFSAGGGGLVGINQMGGLISNSYWDIETSGQTTSAGGVGKTTAQMKRQNTFTNWDFVRVWDIAEDITYPFLRWQLEEGLIVHYKFDELANGKTPDSSAYRYDADVFAAGLVPGKIDGALNFSGWRGRVLVEDTPFLYSDEEMTISAWVNTRKKWKPSQTIVWKGNPDGSPGAVSSDNREFALFLLGARDNSTGGFNSKVQLAFTPENRIGIGQYACTTITFPIRAENWWYHVAGVIDVRNRVMKIYVDGVKVKTCNISSVSNIRNTNGSLVVGNKMPLPAGSSAGFTGKIDDVRIYSKVLSDAEILELAQG
ncbi:MAG: LamG domain-containing protein [Nanoarchaeota archaeon]|nr:LamG domain-containing protein [Nanoarchaeota archaeon]